MKNILSAILFCMGLHLQSQVSYDYYIMNSEVNEFDVIGTEQYETHLLVDQDLDPKLDIIVGSTVKADSIPGCNFRPQNCLDGNMHTAWLTSNNGKNEQIEFVIDIEENEHISAITLFQIALFNGWRKDYQTWKEYGRIKKMSVVINDKPYAEVTMEDTYKHQYIDMEKFRIDKARRYRFRFRILETYPGTKYEQVGLSDVQFAGKIK
jgi:hypothetical protein